ncbi:MAG: hypothetical protein RL129_16 [Actinomycetota bacterium]|jgi:methionyl-tRNA formyltransferase
MRFAFASSSEITEPIARALSSLDGFVGFISNPDKPTGRNQIVLPNSFSKWAQNLGFSPFKPESNTDLEKYISNNDIQLIITCAYGKLIPSTLLNKVPLGWLNIHFSMLPKYRGAAPVQRAIINGDPKTGYSIFKMDEGLDSGPLLVTEEVVIPENIKASELLNMLSKASSYKIVDLLADTDSWMFTKQDENMATHAPKISKDENRINFNQNATEIINKSRGLDINGGVWAMFRGEKHLFSEISFAKKEVEPGEILIEDNKLFVGCKNGSILVGEIQPAGKKTMQVTSWLNGARLQQGERFE